MSHCSISMGSYFNSEPEGWTVSVAGKLHVRGGWSRVPGGWLKKSRGVRKKFEAEFAAGFEMCEGTLLRKPVNKRIERIVADMGKAEEGDDETEQGDL